MTKVDELIAAVHAAPRGPQVAACFDYDGTLIEGYSAGAFMRHQLRNLEIGPLDLAHLMRARLSGVESERDFERLLERTLRSWAGRSEQAMEQLGERLFRNGIAGQLRPELWKLASAHHRMGHTIILASSATRFQVAPMARELGAHHVLFTPLEARDGVLTGATAGRTLWGEGKAAAVCAVAEEHGLQLAESFAYANGDEDVPFLATCGHPVAVCPDDALARVAQRRRWPVLRCERRGRIGQAVALTRTAGFYGAMAAGGGAGVALGLLNRSRTTAIDVWCSVGSDVGLALAGIEVDVVEGREHLWSARPCVFVFNHQSKLDVPLMMNLLRGGITGVMKKEAQTIPGFGQLFQLAGVAFVDRANTARDRRALEPVVAKIRDERVSLVIAPEGTRSATPRLGPFKKGAFHLAMQAGVPIVPIVIRNAGEAMWRGAQTLQAGRVEVAVLPPVDTSAWKRATLDDHVDEVRNMFLDTLSVWPGDGAPRTLTRAAT